MKNDYFILAFYTFIMKKQFHEIRFKKNSKTISHFFYIK